MTGILLSPMVRLPDCPLLDPDEHRSRHCAGTPAVGPSHVEEYPFIQLYDLNRQYQGPRSFFRLFFSLELSLCLSLSLALPPCFYCKGYLSAEGFSRFFRIEDFERWVSRQFRFLRSQGIGFRASGFNNDFGFRVLGCRVLVWSFRMWGFRPRHSVRESLRVVPGRRFKYWFGFAFDASEVQVASLTIRLIAQAFMLASLHPIE